MGPDFRYSCPVWGASGINAINVLQKFQNRAARIVINSAYDASALPIIRKLGWSTITELIESDTLEMVYKSVNDQAPIYLKEMSQYQDRFGRSSSQVGFRPEILFV